MSDSRQRRNRRQRVQLFQPTPGARLTATELLHRSEMGGTIIPPPPVERYEPEIVDALTDPPTLLRVVPDPEDHRSDPQSAETLPPIWLLRAKGATEAYARTSPKFIKCHGGRIYFAVVYKRTGPTTFQAPPQARPEMVAIKRLDRAYLDRYLARGGNENPYRDICRMRELGDDRHVLKCRDALQDDKYLYIVTRKGMGTLVDEIKWRSNELMESQRARKIFIHLLEILQYLEERGVCHRDLSPDNILMLTEDHFVVFDLALSHRIPVNPHGQRLFIQPIGNFGTPAYMSPEIFQNKIFCGVFADLWSAGVILYNLLTNHFLYYMPVPADMLFRYSIVARGLSNTPHNERTVEVLMEVQQSGPEGEPIAHVLFERAVAHLNLSPEAVDLLQGILAESIAERWTLAQAMESCYVLDASF